jgi:protein phosphatase
MTQLRVGSASDTGRVRSNNQDSKLVSMNLFAVADGMGGHQGGEVASALAVGQLRKSVQVPTQEALTEAIRVANRTIYQHADQDPELRGMGTTIAAMALVANASGGEDLAWANVGDSRIYRYRDGDLLQLSRDHSLVEDLRRDGQLSEAEAAVHPQRNILTRALGIDREVEVDSETVEPYAGDRYLLCSDGLFNEVELDRISATLRRLVNPDDAAAELVRLANDHGGRDNITCVIVDVLDDDGKSRTASAAIAGDRGGMETTTRAGETAKFDLPARELSGGSVGAPDDEDFRWGRSDGDVYDDVEDVTSRRFTWRVVLFVLALLAIIGVAVGSVGWYANRSYYVAFNDKNQVAIFQGRPGGVLWVDPRVEQTFTDLTRDQLTGVQVDRLEDQPSFTSKRDATRAVETLRFEVDSEQDRTTTTTTTTTSTLPTTLTPPAPSPP